MLSKRFSLTQGWGKSFYGEPVPASPHARTVDLSKNKPINVDCGDTVTFVNGTKTFTWKFDSIRHNTGVKLAKIAPADFGAGEQTVHIGPSRDELGG